MSTGVFLLSIMLGVALVYLVFVLIPACRRQYTYVDSCSPFLHTPEVRTSVLVYGIVIRNHIATIGHYWIGITHEDKLWGKTRAFDREDWHPIEVLHLATPKLFFNWVDLLVRVGVMRPLHSHSFPAIEKSTFKA